MTEEERFLDDGRPWDENGYPVNPPDWMTRVRKRGEPHGIQEYEGRTPLIDPSSRRDRVPEGAWMLRMVSYLLVFLAGLFVAAGIEDGRPSSTSVPPGAVDVRGHEGEILVVGPNLQVQWTTEAELHREAGHG
jgi:hypothetical protein